MKKKYMPALALVVTGVLLLGTSVAFASQVLREVSYHKITVGNVSGKIEEEYEEGIHYPGSTVKKVVDIRNDGDFDMIPRVQVRKYFDNKSLNPDLIEIDFNSQHWLYDDGWYYYKGVLAPGEKTAEPLFEQFHVSGTANNVYAGAVGHIQIDMECIQAAGNGISFWGKTMEELGIQWDVQQAQTESASVVFQSFDEGFVFLPEDTDLFINFKNLMPGENRSQNIHVENRYKQETEIFLCAEMAEQDENQRDLIEKLIREYCSIVVSDSNGNTIYAGPIYGNLESTAGAPETMVMKQSIGKFLKGEGTDLSISLTVSPDLDNNYQNLTGCINWVWMAESDDEVTAPNLGISSHNHTAMYFSLAGMIICGAALIIGIKKLGKRREGER